MQKMKCCPDAAPQVGETYTCADCGFAVQVTAPCECDDLDCVSLACCGKKMTKST